MVTADIFYTYIIFAGGWSLVEELNDLVIQETENFTYVAKDLLLCLVNRCGQVPSDFKKFKRVVNTPYFIRNAIRDWLHV